MRYYFKPIENGYKIGLATEESEEVIHIVSWIAKPKTYSTEEIRCRELVLTEGAVEIDHSLFTKLYVHINETRKFRLNKNR